MLRVLFAALLLALAQPARAQETATLVADRVAITGDTTLVAEGAVEVFFGTTRLKARRITYDRTTGRLLIEGPITLTEGESIILLADQAELSSDLRDGILRSARLVLEQQLQLAANEVARVSGRYTAMSRVVASSCQVCPGRPTPLWEIRARRVIHDQEERQLYFNDAQFRIAGMPVFYVPRLRMPDPTLDRATGFLLPSFRSTSQLGTGIKLPYFIAIGDHRDLTLTPYISTGGTRTLDWRYRQAFRTGRITFEGGVSRDDILPGDWRGYVLGSGAFDLPADFTLGLTVEAVTDDAYLLDYGIGDKDRLATGVDVTRTLADEHIRAALTHYHSLRDGENNATLPTLVGDATFQRRFTPAWAGGIAGFGFQLHGQRRSSDADGDGRDLARASASLDWRRNWLLPNGMILAGVAEATADFYAISQDTAYPGTVTRFSPAAAVELRWPFVKSEASGAVQVLEPVVQLVWSPTSLADVPNEDSTLVEFDEGNLFSLSRFPGADRHELGLRANVGIGWTRTDATGWSLGVTAGRVLRADDLGQFSTGSGLAGTRSDWLLATRLTTARGLTLTNRALLDDDFGMTRDELRLAWTGRRLGLATSYVWMVADPAEDRLLETSEWVFDAAWQVTHRWSANVEGRYDFTADRAARAGFGLAYRNECVALDLSLSRRFTSSTSVRPTTDIGLSVELSGFGTGSDGRPYRRSCGE